MDITKYNVEKMAEQGAWLDLEHPATGDVIGTEDKPVRIKLLGTDSKAWRNKNREFQRKRIAKLKRNKSRDIDYSASEEETSDMLAACTIGWEGIEENGEAMEFSQETAERLYLEMGWIREQVDAFVGDRANFFPGA